MTNPDLQALKPEDEIWLPVLGYEGFYEVSDQGNVRSTSRMVKSRYGTLSVYLHGKPMKQRKDTSGYQMMRFRKDGERKMVRVHRVVAETFMGVSDLTIDHVNGDKIDNRLSNLEYVSKKE